MPDIVAARPDVTSKSTARDPSRHTWRDAHAAAGPMPKHPVSRPSSPVIRASVTRATLLGALLLGACIPPGEAPDDDAIELGNDEQEVGVGTTPLAYPELDLNVVTNSLWRASATASEVASLMPWGYRLTSIDVASEQPLRFAATYVQNSGPYQRTGQGWNAYATENDLQNMLANPALRVVDIAPYTLGGERRYGVVWLDNTGAQYRDYQVVLHVPYASLVMAANNFGGRVTDLHADGPYLFSAVMIKNTGVDQRGQWIGIATVDQAINLADQHDARVLTLEPWTLDSPYVVYVMEARLRAVGERTWWASELIDDPVGGVDNDDSLYHAPKRFGGRYAKLNAYPTSGGVRYFGFLADNAPVPTSGSDNAGNATLDQIDDTVRDLMKREGIPGATLAIVKNGKLIHAKGYGYANLATSRTTQPTDSFRIASVSKTITGTAILRMIQDGRVLPRSAPKAGAKLTLDTHPWGDLWPYTPPAGQPIHLGQITIRNLLEHATDLDNDRFEWATAPATWVTTEQNNVATGTASFKGAPGTLANATYMNANYYMLGQVVTSVTGQPLATYVRDTLLTPVGVGRVLPGHVTGAADVLTTYQAFTYNRPGRYFRRFRDLQGVLGDGPNDRGDWAMDPALLAASGYAASPLELLRMMVSLNGARPGARALDNASYWAIRDKVSPDLQPGWCTGRGLAWWGNCNAPTGRGYEHGGYLPGTTEAVARMRDDGIEFVFATNSDSLGNLDALSLKHGFGGALLDTLDQILDAQGGALPDRDLFPAYGMP
ncbi:MAG: beta-lactamase family protein [Deltaproteobacteria bacterium]|nr:beta-lactamase family protein [Deltaproteobacteria bacterium]